VQQGASPLEILTSERSSFVLTRPLNDRVSVRVYPDSSPRHLETSFLQKGLVLLLDGHELIEEGVGFGVPVVKYGDKTYFSSTAQVSVERKEKRVVWTKSFVMDTVSRKRVGGSSFINDRLYRLLHKMFERLYLGFSGLFPFFNKLMELRRVMSVQTVFIKVKPRGKIAVEYSLEPDEINVKVNLSDLEDKNFERILLLNEQGASFFGEYSDSEGVRLHTFRIGAWEKVEANSASLSILQGSLRFHLRNQPMSELYRGWEKTKGRFAWSGLSYSLNRKTGVFGYSIGIADDNWLASPGVTS
jgi:hypothetical protein